MLKSIKHQEKWTAWGVWRPRVFVVGPVLDKNIHRVYLDLDIDSEAAAAKKEARRKLYEGARVP